MSTWADWIENHSPCIAEELLAACVRACHGRRWRGLGIGRPRSRHLSMYSRTSLSTRPIDHTHTTDWSTDVSTKHPNSRHIFRTTDHLPW